MAKKKKEEKIALTKSDNILLGNNENVDKITDDLKKYVDEKVSKTFIDEIDKANKKLLREKSKKIITKNIIIIILLLIIGFLLYLMYSNNYFDKFFNKDSDVIEEKDKKDEEGKKEKEDSKKEEEKESQKEPTEEELKKEYAYLLDNYFMSDKSLYLKDFYEGNLTSEIKQYLTLNSFDFNSLKKEDGYHIILNDTFKIAYDKLFNDNYYATNFDYNGNQIRYVSMMNSYITASILEKEDSLIKREIKNIKLDNDNVIITTVEGIIKDNKLYNITTDTEILDYQEGSLLKYSEELNKVIYTFKDGKLVNLAK